MAQEAARDEIREGRGVEKGLRPFFRCRPETRRETRRPNEAIRGPLSARTIGVRALTFTQPDQRKELSHDPVEQTYRNCGSRSTASVPPASRERPDHRPRPPPLRRSDEDT